MNPPTLAGFRARVRDALATTGYPVVDGPPWENPPASPCITVGLPDATAPAACALWDVEMRAYLIPRTNDLPQLAVMADEAIAALHAHQLPVIATYESTEWTDSTIAVYALTIRML